ncbi:MAG: ornithine carbamoyltransferase, partial [Pelagibaca sp.]|nr:ornithine carbamoyltransferase [Pelagibaca sp.]
MGASRPEGQRPSAPPDKKNIRMNHFLDIHKTDKDDLRSIIDAAKAIK